MQFLCLKNRILLNPRVINFLKKQKKVKEILYPHKPGTKNYKLWKKYYKGANGLFSIVIKAKKKYSVHDKDNKFKNGDKVTIVECKPYSKTKKFEVMGETK